MTRTLLLTLLIATAPLAAHANTVIAHVDGMVCAFCVKGLEDKLKQDASVGEVKVSLEESLVTVTSKPGAMVSEDTVKKAVFYMDYKLRDIKTVE